MSNKFRRIFSSLCNNLIKVTKYQSSDTGLTVTIADVDGPTVNGFICFATEDTTDDGLPHTLEHLVFMGSEHYPSKGILDILANRCLASGTNACTGQNYTYYTLQTAGSDGFLKMLPIYLDHLFHPLLTDAQFTTEIHHINDKGEDAGVVYCEMQDHESDMQTLSLRTLSKSLYAPDCGYSAYTGGQLPNLRTSTTNEKIKKYHDKFYHPKNANVIITGTLDHEQVFKVLEPVEKNLLTKEKIKKIHFEKPWSSKVAPLDVTSEINQPCPVDDDSKGYVVVGWRGPESKDIYTFVAIGELLDYLTDSSVSPLRQNFVEIENPYCSKVSNCQEDYSASMFTVSFKGAIKEKLKEFKPKLFEILRSLASDNSAFDMGRMTDILQQSVDKTLCVMETSPHDYLTSSIMNDFLFGSDQTDFETRLNLVSIYKRLLKESVEFWKKLISSYFLEGNYVLVIGDPSKKLIEEVTLKENTRIEKQRKDLGEAQLKILGEKLEAAVDENEETDPDEDVLNSCIVNSMDGIKFFQFNHVSNLSGNKFFQQSLDSVPFSLILDDCSQTNFLKVFFIVQQPFLFQVGRIA